MATLRAVVGDRFTTNWWLRKDAAIVAQRLVIGDEAGYRSPDSPAIVPSCPQLEPTGHLGSTVSLEPRDGGGAALQ